MKSITKQTLMSVEKILNSTIVNCLYGPTGDPNWGECRAAANCFEILKLLDLKIDNENEVKEELSNPNKNISNENFLK